MIKIKRSGFLRPASGRILLPIKALVSGSFQVFPESPRLFNGFRKIAVKNIKNTFKLFQLRHVRPGAVH